MRVGADRSRVWTVKREQVDATAQQLASLRVEASQVSVASLQVRDCLLSNVRGESLIVLDDGDFVKVLLKSAAIRLKVHRRYIIRKMPRLCGAARRPQAIYQNFLVSSSAES